MCGADRAVVESRLLERLLRESQLASLERRIAETRIRRLFGKVG